MNNTVILPRKLVQQLFHHAQSAPEDEVCGLISRNDGNALQQHKMNNVAANTADQFLMDEAQLLKTLKGIRESGAELFGIYHSHPTAAAVPSARDLAESGYPEAWHLIISLNTKGVLELRCWQLMNDEARETPLRIIED